MKNSLFFASLAVITSSVFGMDLNIPDKSQSGGNQLISLVEKGNFAGIKKEVTRRYYDYYLDEIVSCLSAYKYKQAISKDDFYEKIRVLKERFKNYIDEKDNKGRTPLLLAGERVLDTYSEFMGLGGNSDNKEFKKIVEYLVRKGANINEKDSYGKTLLIQATSGGQVPVVKWLIELGADTERVNEDEDSLLFFVLKNYCRGKGYDLNKLLIEDQKMDINQKNKAGDTPLLYVTNGEFNDFYIKYFIEHGADVNIQNKNGNTTLMNYLINERYPEESLIRSFIKHGADIHAQNNKGQTPFSYVNDHRYSSYSGSEALVDLFKKADKDKKMASARKRAATDPDAIAKREARALFREAVQSIDPEENFESAVEMYKSEEKRVRSGADMKKSLDRKSKRTEAQANYNSSLEAADRMIKHGKIEAPASKNKSKNKEKKNPKNYRVKNLNYW